MDNNKFILTTFNDQFKELIEDIERIFPNDVEIRTCKNALITMRKANPKLIITSMKPYLLKYQKQIEANDVNFFIDKNYVEDVGFKKEENTKIFLDKIEQLRQPLHNMGLEDKDKITNYMKNLLQLVLLYN